MRIRSPPFLRRLFVSGHGVFPHSRSNAAQPPLQCLPILLGLLSYAQYFVVTYKEKESEKSHILNSITKLYNVIYIHNPVCYTLETNITLYINCNSIKKKRIIQALQSVYMGSSPNPSAVQVCTYAGHLTCV